MGVAGHCGCRMAPPGAGSTARTSVGGSGAISAGVGSCDASYVNEASELAPGAVIQRARIDGLKLVSERSNATREPRPAWLYRCDTVLHRGTNLRPLPA